MEKKTKRPRSWDPEEPEEKKQKLEEGSFELASV